VPPKSGDVWRINLYAMRQNGGVAFSPILGQGNFHKASRFAKVTWVIPGAPPVGVGGASSVGDGGEGNAALGAGEGGAGMLPPLVHGKFHMMHPLPVPPPAAGN
jgi:hypothetical protein